MKRISAIIAVVLLMIGCQAVCADDISVNYNGSVIDFDVSPCIVDDRTLVPVRGVFDAIGITFTWDGDSKMIYASKDDITLWIQVNNDVVTYKKNGIMASCKLDVAPCIISDRVFIPVRVVAEIFDVDVSWNAELRTVMINTAVYDEEADYDDSYIENDADCQILLEGFEAPVTLNCGQAFTLAGEVVADSDIDRLNVKIRDKESDEIEINETQFDIQSPVYSLSDIDSRVRFGTLGIGEKIMEITAVTADECRMTFSYDFEVQRPGGVVIDGDVSMLWPVPSSGMITTIFWCDNVFCHSNEGRANGHSAIDIAAPQGADVVAVSDGVVIQCGFGDYSNGHTGYGNFIEVDHGNGIVTQYAHLHTIYVSEGDEVTAGQVIGGVGSTGRSTGNHLDFAIEKDGERCDPLYYIDIHEDARCYEECDAVYFEEAMASRGIKK